MAFVNQSNPSAVQVNQKPYFIGYSTIGKTRAPFRLTDIDLVKQDLLNQFNTPMGSRVMLPNFGSNIQNYLFDPFDDVTRNNIIQDATNVVQSDPRVELISINVTQSGKAITVAMILKFLPQSLTDSLFVTFTALNQQTY